MENPTRHGLAMKNMYKEGQLYKNKSPGSSSSLTERRPAQGQHGANHDEYSLRDKTGQEGRGGGRQAGSGKAERARTEGPSQEHARTAPATQAPKEGGQESQGPKPREAAAGRAGRRAGERGDGRAEGGRTDKRADGRANERTGERAGRRGGRTGERAGRRAGGQAAGSGRAGGGATTARSAEGKHEHSPDARSWKAVGAAWWPTRFQK